MLTPVSLQVSRILDDSKRTSLQMIDLDQIAHLHVVEELRQTSVERYLAVASKNIQHAEIPIFRVIPSKYH